MSKKKLVLFGASGFIGKNLSNILRTSGHFGLVKAPNRSEVNLTDQRETLAYLVNEEPDVIINAAGLVGGISRNIEIPYDLSAVNSRIALNISDYLRDRTKELRYIAFGSTCMFPIGKGLDADYTADDLMGGPIENTSQGYAHAKYLSLALLKSISKINNNLISTFLIPATCYGPFDHFSKDRSHVIGSIFSKIRTAVAQGEPIVKFLGDGTPVRQFTYVSDLCNLVLARSLESTCGRGAVDVITCPSDDSIASISDLVHIIGSLHGFKGEIEWSHELGGAQRKVSSYEPLRQAGYSCPTGLIDGLTQTKNWLDEHS